MNRPRTSVFVGMSLDGFIARPDGTLDWLTSYEGEDHGFGAFIESVDTVVIGRGTYDFVLGMLARGEGWFYAGKRCVVMTHRPIAGKNGETAFAGEPAALLEQLGRDGARHVYVDGGVVIRSFLAAGLIDEMTISVVAVSLKTGLPLFGGVKVESGMNLEGVHAFADGLAQLRFRLKA